MTIQVADHRWTQDTLEQLNVAGPVTVTVGPVTLPSNTTIASGATGGQIHSASVAATAGLNTTETIVAGPLVLTPAVTLKVGSRVRFVLHGTCTSSNADVSTFTIRAGILGTTSDASVATFTVTSSGSGTAQAFTVRGEFTVQTLGAAGTAFGSGEIGLVGTTGLGTLAFTVKPFTSTTLATTTATNLEVSYVAAAVTTTCTFQDCYLEVIS